MWCWGSNENGQLGLGDRTKRLTPTRVGSATSWQDIDTGATHTCATRTDSNLWCWGGNEDGQLGLGDRRTRLYPRHV
jgi:alpha-tubulin suppressor-like RCC1 family protein